MKCFIIIFLLIILIFLFPIKLKGKLVYNLFKNQGIISIYFYKLKLFVSHFKILPHKVLIYGKHKKSVSIYFFDKNNSQSNLTDIFIMQLIKHINLNHFRIIANMGFAEDALAASLLSATFVSLAGSVTALISATRLGSNISTQIFTSYTKTKFIFALSSSISLNLLIIAYCFLTSLIIKLKRRI